ncbi:MAG: glucokinase [Acidiferrobacterales bacterium]
MILAGDIGGTKTVIALFEETGGNLREVRGATFPSKEHGSLEEILEKFLHDESDPALQVGCFGVAGPVINGKSKTTNLPWELDEQALAKAIGARRVKLLNDLEAAAFGMLHLKPDEFCVLNEGAEPKRQGNIAVVAAGTGLGEAMLIWDGEKHHPVASEGGHADFAPRNAQEIELLNYLSDKYRGHVSYERILSGPGFFNLYTFLRQSNGTPEPDWLKEKLQSGDPSAIVTEVGLAGKDPVCVRSLELFASIYGAEAGNLALKCLAMGGVLIGGGIAPKILPALESGRFTDGFKDKGRYAALMQSMPVKVALNPRAPLIGAAHYTLRL